MKSQWLTTFDQLKAITPVEKWPFQEDLGYGSGAPKHLAQWHSTSILGSWNSHGFMQIWSFISYKVVSPQL